MILCAFCRGSFALFLGADFAQGSTAKCTTFDNPPLCKKELFECVAIEVWGFTAKGADVVDFGF
jgi:hypothetical protein